MSQAGGVNEEQATEDRECRGWGLGLSPKGPRSHGRVLFEMMK